MSSKELTDFWVDIGYRTRQQVDDLLAAYPHNTRWDKVYYKDDAPFQEHNLNISGGGGKTTYFVSGGYLKQEGLAYRSGYKRYTMRANITSTVNNWMRFGINTSGGYDKQETNPYGGSSSDRGLAFMAPPYYSIYDKNGHEYPDLIPGLGRYHPKYLADKNRSKSNSLLLNLSGYIEVNPVKNLTLKTQAGLEASDSRTSSVRLPSYLGSLNNGSASESFSKNGIQNHHQHSRVQVPCCG